MKHLKHSLGLILIVLLALTLLSACGGSASAPATTPTITAPSVAGEFVEITNKVDRIALSTNGQQLIAYACDGYPRLKHAPTFAVWFKGAVSHNAVSLFAKNGEHLVATLTPQSATGTATLTGGKSFSFTAIAVTGMGGAGLYRSEQTFGGVRYLAGWIIPTIKQVTLSAPASSALASLALLSGWLNPFSPAMIGPAPERGGAIINEQTGAILTPPLLTDQDLARQQVPVPGQGGSFRLTYCQQGQC